MQDVSQDDIPIMLVGNKTDLRNEALRDGVTCIPTSYGEKLAMVRTWTLFTMIYHCFLFFTGIVHPKMKMIIIYSPSIKPFDFDCPLKHKRKVYQAAKFTQNTMTIVYQRHTYRLQKTGLF